MDQEPKATRSGNVCIHGMRFVTKASLAYVATQVSMSDSERSIVELYSAGSICFDFGTSIFRTDLITDSKRFYTSILDLLDDPDEKDEVDQLVVWWNR